MVRIHYFDIDLAKEIGVYPAIIFNCLAFWIDKNEANNKNFFDGYYWTYNSVTAFQKLFPYLTLKQVRTSLEKLIKDGYVKTGNYNKDKCDKTHWYAMTEKGRSVCVNGIDHVPCEANPSALHGKPSALQGKPIPVNIPFNTSFNKERNNKERDDINFEEIVDYLNLKAEKNYKSSSRKTRDLIRARMNDGFDINDFKKVIDNKCRSWKGTNMDEFLRPETLFGTKFEGYLNEKYVPKKGELNPEAFDW